MALGEWVSTQRSVTNISSERKKQLDDLGFIWDPHKESWDKNFQALALYKAEFGDCSVPKGYKTPNGINLGQWVIAQRKNKEISSERKKQLDDLGFIWGAGAL